MKTQEHLHPILDQFLTTGRLGTLIPGRSTIVNVSEVLGPPDDRSEQRNPEIWKYRDVGAVLRKLGTREEGGEPSPIDFEAQVQLSFYRRPADSKATLTTIGLFPVVSEGGFPGLIYRGSHPVMFEDFTQLLDRLELRHTSVVQDSKAGCDAGAIEGGATQGGPRLVELKSGVRATFLDGRLQNLMLSVKSKAEGKQITLFVPNDILDRARKLASDEPGATIASICTRWLVEHARGIETTQSG